MTYLALVLLFQTTEPVSEAPLQRELFGISVDVAGDLNADGVRDFWVGDPSNRAGQITGGGKAWAICGSTGSTLHRIDSPSDALGFGWTVVSIGDIDGDGVIDIAVGCWLMSSVPQPPATSESADTSQREGVVYVHSGSDGALRFLVRGPATCPVFTPLDDWNDDDVPDFAIGWSLADHHFAVEGSPITRQLRGCGRVDVASGRDGKTIRSWHGERAGDRLGASLTSVPDLDTDGRLDLAIGSFCGEGPGSVRVVSSKGAAVQTLTPVDGSRNFSVTMIASTRASKDGVTPELFVGQNDEQAGRAAITRWNLRTGALVQTIPRVDRVLAPGHSGESIEMKSFPTCLLWIEDRDGDRLPELLGTAPDGFGVMPAAVVSSSTGQPHGRVDVPDVPHWLSEIGTATCSAGDVDKDGVEDFVVAGANPCCGASNCTGAVLVISGKTLKTLRFFSRVGRE